MKRRGDAPASSGNLFNQRYGCSRNFFGRAINSREDCGRPALPRRPLVEPSFVGFSAHGPRSGNRDPARVEVPKMTRGFRRSGGPSPEGLRQRACASTELSVEGSAAGQTCNRLANARRPRRPPSRRPRQDTKLGD